MDDSSPPARLSLLALLLATGTMIALRVHSYTPLLALAGARTLLAETYALLFAYAVVIAWPQRSRQPSRVSLLRSGPALRFGLAAGALQILHVILERFTSPPPSLNEPLSIVFELGTFLLWAAAAFHARSRGCSLFTSCAAAIWAAVVTMTLAVSVGTLLEYFLAPTPIAQMVSWAEFQRSGWHDLQAFSIANTLDSASSHLLLGPILALLFGLAGTSFASLRRNRVQATV